MLYTTGGSDDDRVRRFEVCTNTQLTNFATGFGPQPGSQCESLRIRPNGEVLVACHTGVVRLSSTGHVLQTFTFFRDSQGGPIPEVMYGLDLDPDGAHFLVSAWSFQFRSDFP